VHLSKTRLDNMTVEGRWNYLVMGIDTVAIQKFQMFHKANPHVFAYLEQVADEQYHGGWRKSSVWLILNLKRWGPGSTVDTESQYKISNDYFAYYARLLISRNTKYANWVELKAMKGQKSEYRADSFLGRDIESVHRRG